MLVPRKLGWKYAANRKMKMVYRPINDNGKWRARYNSEIYTVYDELDIVKVTKTGRQKWLDHLFIMQELGPCRRLIRLKPEGT